MQGGQSGWLCRSGGDNGSLDQAGSGVKDDNGMDLRDLPVGKLRGLDDCLLGEEDDREREEGA